MFINSYATSAFTFIFDLCHPVLENANINCEYNCSFLCPMAFDIKTNADVTCEQGLITSNYIHRNQLVGKDFLTMMSMTEIVHFS